MGRCSECETWNSLIEEVVQDLPQNQIDSAESSSPIKLSEIFFDEQPRVVSQSEEFNRVLGGGFVIGSVILLGGDPGIGKSTLMLQVAANSARKDFRTLYVSGEESAHQTKMRATRLDLNSESLYIHSETDLIKILDAFETLKPKLVVIDSIQTVYQSALESAPGSISQVRECAHQFSQTAKRMNVPVVLIGHVTKEGHLAGPKVLEHIVDVLLQFEGDRNHVYRILRTEKNRFGSTREIGVFEMTESGMKDVKNPSAHFLEDRRESATGCSVICTIEGTRPFLVEIQALVSATNYGLPQRAATGVDPKRLALLLAVLEKRIGLGLGTHDVFINAAGGVRLEDPAADLGILLSIVSSFKDEVVNSKAVCIGEIGLSGEIRSVPHIQKRIEEVAKLGFTQAVIPKSNLKSLEGKQGSLNITAVGKVRDVLDLVLG
ncbi:DNA repair protein RadA [bacterium]|nr:DNA repair protein RadA [bacterium]